MRRTATAAFGVALVLVAAVAAARFGGAGDAGRVAAAPAGPAAGPATAPAGGPSASAAVPPATVAGPAVRPALRAADVAGRRTAAPVVLRIPSLGVDAPVAGVGATGGQLEVIDDVVTVGWYRHGPAPGDPGSAVLAAHVDHWRDGPGVFFRLADLDPGARIEVTLDDGTARRFVVADRRRHPRDRLPTDALFARAGDPVLTLITCGGRFDTATRSYEDNVVVRAVPEG